MLEPSREVHPVMISQVRRHGAIASLSQQALANSELGPLMEATVDCVATLLGIDVCTIWELLPNGTTLQFRACAGPIGAVPNLTMSDAGPEAPEGLTLLSKEPVIIHDLRTDTRFGGTSVMHAHQASSGITVLIDGRDRPFGILGVYTVDPGRVELDDVHFLHTITAILAAAIERKQAEVVLQQLKDDLEVRVQERTDELQAVNARLRAELKERAEIEQQLLHATLHDPMTGLPNRKLFFERLSHALARAQRRDGPPFTVLFLDLDRFKAINDQLGHLAGDQLLIEVARRLQQRLRPGDTVARLSGDEFAFLLEDMSDTDHARSVAERIQYDLTCPIHMYGHTVVTSGSMGIAPYLVDDRAPEDLLRHADLALYQAKALGRARAVVYDSALDAHALFKLQFETELSQALGRQQLLVHYQPIVSIADGRLLGVEALVRWQHPQRGLIAPLDFIPLAEDTGQIVPLGAWILETACRQARAWQKLFPDRPPLIMSVNISARQFQHKDIVQMVARTLEETDLDPQYLEIELTESSMMDDVASTIKVLQELHAVRIHAVAIDDFGTGYSSLNYLKQLPITGVKIDRSFVADLTGNSNDTAIAAAIIAMAHKLHLNVVAEGVETQEQLTFLQHQHCDAVQGFLASPPVAAEVLTTRLARGWQFLPVSPN